MEYNFTELDGEEIERYNRQIILPQVGTDGQIRLKNAKVLIIGAGGLGSPTAMYLAGAGIGTIGIMDADTVSISNLQRQILHNTENTGMNKAESAKSALHKLNDKITVKAYPYFLTAENAEQIIGGYDFIIDSADNFETKFLINDTCVLLKKPFCHAGITGFEGQVMTYVPENKPCYRCIFEEIPEQGTIPNCSQNGIIGAVAGIIGSIQALEAIKYILNIGELLTGKMFIADGLSMKTRIAKFPVRNKNCRVCGENPKIKSINPENYVVVCRLQ
ncbi:MAG: HesA/MoeB/ThiF family protein [Ruminococcus flavefaciens]|nr:HesA/MoeB/ThiF family protein [Ruminococcus flavefaciens]